MVSQESQKKHPFGLSEKRFRWNKVSNGNDIRLFAHKFINKKTCPNWAGFFSKQ